MGSFLSLFLSEEDQGPSLLELLNQDAVDWQAIEQRLQEYPEEAAAYGHSIDASPLVRSLQKGAPLAVVRALVEAYDIAVFHHDDEQGTSPLLAAMQANNGEQEQHSIIVNLLLEINPRACSEADRQGRLPVHFVRTCPKSAESLIASYPAGVSQTDSKGRLALHYCCECTVTNNDDQQDTLHLSVPDINVVRLLLSNSTLPSAGVLLKDKSDGNDSSSSTTPLDIICREWQRMMREDEARKLHADQLWEILVMMVQAAVRQEENDNQCTFSLVHALVAVHCPVPVLEEALRLFPNQAKERDKQGRTPLLLASADKNIDTATVCCLIQFNPQAARMMDSEGRLPIDLIAENPNVSDSDVLEAIVRAEPRAVDTRDLKYHRHPFLTAALAGAHQGSIYHLLRAQPHVIKHYLLSETD